MARDAKNIYNYSLWPIERIAEALDLSTQDFIIMHIPQHLSQGLSILIKFNITNLVKL
jgi:hypothetical protein